MCVGEARETMLGLSKTDKTGGESVTYFVNIVYTIRECYVIYIVFKLTHYGRCFLHNHWHPHCLLLV